MFGSSSSSSSSSRSRLLTTLPSSPHHFAFSYYCILFILLLVCDCRKLADPESEHDVGKLQKHATRKLVIAADKVVTRAIVRGQMAKEKEEEAKQATMELLVATAKAAAGKQTLCLFVPLSRCLCTRNLSDNLAWCLSISALKTSLANSLGWQANPGMCVQSLSL